MLEQQEQYNDNQFRKRLDASKDPVWFCGRYLSEKGYSISIEPTVQGLHKEWREYRDQGDLYISKPGWMNGKPQRIEVKQLSAITSPTNFKFPSVIVCAAHSWDEATPKPHLYILMGKHQQNYCAMILSKDQPKWFKRVVPDKYYTGSYEQEMYLCPKELMHWRHF